MRRNWTDEEVKYLTNNYTQMSYIDLSKNLDRSVLSIIKKLSRLKLVISKKHLYSKMKIYKRWKDMKSRCNCPGSSAYKNYGGRNIKVCKEWASSFESFRKWAESNGYNDNLTIERIDVNKDYCPENCKFITKIEQAKNKTNTLRITAFNETKSLQDWVLDSRCVVSVYTLRARINNNWKSEEAITTKTLKNKRNVVMVTIFGETKSCKAWSKDNRCKVSYKTLKLRIHHGVDPELAITMKDI